MVPQDTLLVLLVCMIDLIPTPPTPDQPERGHPQVYPNRLFLKALVIMIVRHVHTPAGLLRSWLNPPLKCKPCEAT